MSAKKQLMKCRPTDRAAGEPLDSVQSTPNPPVKRSNSVMSEDRKGDEDDEEPVKKRPRKGRAPEISEKPSKNKSLQSNKDSPKTCMTASAISHIENKDEKTTAKATHDLKDPKVTVSHRKPSSKQPKEPSKEAGSDSIGSAMDIDEAESNGHLSDARDVEVESDDDEKPEIAAKAREKVQLTLKRSEENPYPDWKSGEPVPYAALCTTFSLIEMTTKRLAISAHCSLFLRQVLRLTPQDLLPTIQLMINKLAADYAGIELGIGESLIMKAIGESTGRSLQVIKADQNEIGDLGLVAAKSRSNQPTMFRPKPLTVRGVLEGLMGIATVSGDGSQGRKIAGIKKLLSAADAALTGKASKNTDITKDKGGPSEAKFIIRFLEGKLRLGLAEKTVLVALAHAMVVHETQKTGGKLPGNERLAEGEAILKTVYR